VSGWPALVAEWHPIRNRRLEPHQVSHGSGRKVWWRCPRGPDHEWRASVNNRVAGKTGCPFCAGRLPSVTNALASQRPDLATQWHPTKNRGLTPDRIVLGSERLVWWKCPVAADHQWAVSPHARSRAGGACPFCIGLRVSTTNSLASLEPRIAREWHPSKNGALTARQVVTGSSRLVWWQCRESPDHEWRASIANRCIRSSGCPFCAGRRASQQHCLAMAYPATAAEWHPTLNGDLTARSVTPHAQREVWWRCRAGHEWRCRVSQRTRKGSRCPDCAQAARAHAPVVPAGRPSPARAPHAGRCSQMEHGRIEQTLVLLASDPGVEDSIVERVLSDVRAHLAVEETVVFAAVEESDGRDERLLSRLRDLHRRMRILVSKISGGQRAVRWACLHNLSVTFREHARLVDREVVPVLEGSMTPASFEALERRMRELRAAATQS
jgi:hypothetical protein